MTNSLTIGEPFEKGRSKEIFSQRFSNDRASGVDIQLPMDMLHMGYHRGVRDV